MNTTRDIVTAFFAAFDLNDHAGFAPLTDPEGSWWVDSGLDRAAGVHGVDPGDARGWPLHGTMPMGEKVEMLRGIRTRFPTGIRQMPWNMVVDGGRAAVEVLGDGTNTAGARYRNRYCFLIDVVDRRVRHIREYLDTHHSVTTFQNVKKGERTVAPAPGGELETSGSALDDLALKFCAAIGAADPDALLGLATPYATWWADTGTDREGGRFESPIRPDGELIGTALLSERVKSLPGLTKMFRDGWSLVPTRITSEGNMTVVECSSDGTRAASSSRPEVRYQNRYAFVLETNGSKIMRVREYCDTHHVFDVFGIG